MAANFGESATLQDRQKLNQIAKLTDELRQAAEEMKYASQARREELSISAEMKERELEALRKDLAVTYKHFNFINKSLQAKLEQDDELKQAIEYETVLMKELSIAENIERRKASSELEKKTDIFLQFSRSMQDKGDKLNYEQKLLLQSVTLDLERIQENGFNSLADIHVMSDFLKENENFFKDMIELTADDKEAALDGNQFLEKLLGLSEKEALDRADALKQAAMDRARDKNKETEDTGDSFLDTILKPFKWIFSIAKIALPILVGFFALDKVFGKGEMLKGLMEFIESIKPAIMEIGKSIFEFIKSIVPMIKDLVVAMMPAISSLIKAFAEVLKKILPNLISLVKKIADLVVKALPPLVDFITNAVVPAIEFLLQGFTIFVDKFFEFPRAMSAIVIAATAAFSNISSVVMSAIKSSKGVMTFFTNVSSFFSTITGFLTKIPLLGKGVSGLGKIIGNIGSTIAKFGSAFGKLLKFLGWPLQIIMSVLDFIKGYQDTEGGVFDKIIGGIKAVIKGILYLPLELIDLVASFFGIENFTSSIREVADMVIDAIFSPIETMNKLFTWLSDVFSDAFSSLWDGMKEAAAFAWDIITLPYRKLWEFFQWLGGKIVDAFKALWDGMQTAITFIWDIITWPYRKITEIFTAVDTYLSQTFGQAWEQVKEIGSRALDVFMTPINLVKDLFNFIGDTFSGIYEGAKEKVAGMWETVKSFPSRILSGFISWLIEWLDDSWIPGSGKLANWLRDKAKDWGVDLSGSESVDSGDQLKSASDFSKGDMEQPDIEPKDISPQLLSSYKKSADASFGYLLTEEERKKLHAVQSLAELEQLKKKAIERQNAEMLAAQKATANNIQAAANQMQQTTQIVISNQQNNTNYNHTPTGPNDPGIMNGTSNQPAY